MKCFTRLSLLFSLVVSVTATAERDLLQQPDFDVTITGVSGQFIFFDTGFGIEGDSSIKVKVSDLCRAESPVRTEVGYLFPQSTVPGINSNGSGVLNNPGPGNFLSFKFAQDISQNANIYTPAAGNTATVSFCVEVGLYAGDMQVNFEEVKLTYNVDLQTKVGSLTGHTP